MFRGTHFYLNTCFVKNDETNRWNPGKELYEVFRVINAVPLFLNDHLNRLNRFFELQNERKQIDKVELRQIVLRLIHENNLKNTNVRISFDLLAEMKMAIGEIGSYYPSKEEYLLGVSSLIMDAERTHPNLKLHQAGIKEMAQKLIDKASLYDVILCNEQGELTEGSRTNIFFIKNGNVYTSPLKQVLPGITRQKVLDICEASTIPIVIDKLNKIQVESYEAAFFTGTSPQVLPIRKINDANYDVKNPTLALLMQKFSILVAKDLEDFVKKYV